jgi:hypothetical protein
MVHVTADVVQHQVAFFMDSSIDSVTERVAKTDKRLTDRTLLPTEV